MLKINTYLQCGNNWELKVNTKIINKEKLANSID